MSIVRSGNERPQEVLLQDRITAFKSLRQDKEEALRKLWEEWEDTQLELIGLAAEALGRDALTFAQVRDEDLKPGQREKLQNTLMNAQRLFEKKRGHHESLQQDLGAFEENIDQIASKTEKTVAEMQQVSMPSAVHCSGCSFVVTAIQFSEKQVVQRPTPTHRASCRLVRGGACLVCLSFESPCYHLALRLVSGSAFSFQIDTTRGQRAFSE